MNGDDFKGAPPGWEKGEPLSVNRVSETCYQLYRSGSYLRLPGAPVSKEVEYLEFSSRVAMVAFQKWWDEPHYSYRDRDAPHFWLTSMEFIEVLEEMFALNLRQILGNRQGVETVPRFTMAIQVEDGATQRRLEDAHHRYVEEVRGILGVRG